MSDDGSTTMMEEMHYISYTLFPPKFLPSMRCFSLLFPSDMDVMRSDIFWSRPHSERLSWCRHSVLPRTAIICWTPLDPRSLEEMSRCKEEEEMFGLDPKPSNILLYTHTEGEGECKYVCMCVCAYCSRYYGIDQLASCQVE